MVLVTYCWVSLLDIQLRAPMGLCSIYAVRLISAKAYEKAICVGRVYGVVSSPQQRSIYMLSRQSDLVDRCVA